MPPWPHAPAPTHALTYPGTFKPIGARQLRGERSNGGLYMLTMSLQMFPQSEKIQSIAL